MPFVLCRFVPLAVALLALPATHPPQAPTDASKVRTALLWWIPLQVEPSELNEDARKAVAEFRARQGTFRSHLRPPADRDFPVRAAFEKKQALERTIVGLFAGQAIDAAAASFAEAVSPSYEWEGFSGGPLAEIDGAEQFLIRYPKMPIRSYALLLIAHRCICALDALQYEARSGSGDSASNLAQQARLRQRLPEAVREASLSEHPLVRFVAADVERRPRCFTDP